MTLYKMVDGKRIKMSAEEEASLRAEWAAVGPETSAPVRTIQQIAADVASLQAELQTMQNLAQLQDLANG